MKKQLLAGAAVLVGAGFAGMAAAQSGPGVWPQVSLVDLEACRPIISKVHAIEKLEIRQLITEQCGADPRKYSRSDCKAARRWLGNTQAKDHVVWYFEGNDSCSASNYPCFGVSNYNRPRGGEDAKRWVQFFREKAAVTPFVTQGMDLRTGVREADRCVARIWADKYDRANPPRREPPPSPPSAPLLASAAAAAKVVEETIAATTDATTDATTAATTAAITTATTTLIADVQQTPPTTTTAATTTTTEQGAAATTTETVTPPTTAVATAAPAGAATTAAPAPATAAAAAAPVVPAVAEPVELAGAPENARLAACRAGVAAKRDLDKALIACFTTGATDGEVLTLRGQIHLLAGRYQDAWNDFNIAWTDYQANVALFLRGLASAGLGRTAGALRDMAQAEEAQAGLLETWAAQGYSLAGALTRKPLAPDAPAPPVAAAAPAPAPVAPPPPPPAVTVDKAPGKPIEISVVPAALAVVAGVVAAAPLPPPAAIKEAPITPPMEVPEDAPVKKAEPVPTKAAYDAELPADDPRKTATDCLEPLQQGDAGNPERDDVFRNKCDYAVRLVYCNVPKMSSGLSLPFACGSTTGLMVHLVAANSLQPARLGKEVAYFGCRSGARPDVDYSAEQGLFGYCR